MRIIRKPCKVPAQAAKTAGAWEIRVTTFDKLMLATAAAALLGLSANVASAADKPADAKPPVVWLRNIPLDVALATAQVALNECRKNGRHPSVGVMDKDGNMIVLLIDDNAAEVGQHALVTKMHYSILLQNISEQAVERAEPKGTRSEIDTESEIVGRFNDHFLISPGGYALKVGREMVGVLGVGGTGLGMSPGSEGECAQVGGDWFEANYNK